MKDEQNHRKPFEALLQERTVDSQSATPPGFGVIFQSATGLWKGNLIDLAVLSLALCFLIWIPILQVAFLAGYLRALLKVIRGRKVEIGELFSAWDCFGGLLVYLLLVTLVVFVLGRIPVLGGLAGLAVSVAATPGMYAIVDRGSAPLVAAGWSWKVFRADMLPWTMVVVLGGLLSGLGVLALGIGIIVTLAWGSLMSALLYEQQTNPSS